MQNVPWVDKYRPKKLDDIIHQEEVIKVLKKTLETGQMPHLLLYGPSGTGKCLGLNTPIIMFDGSIKMVQDVKQNDLLMGDDNSSRRVLSIARGKDTMYRVIQGNGDNYTVNSENIISLKLSSPFLEKWSEKEQRYRLYWFENYKKQQKSFYVQQNDTQKNYKTNYLIKDDAYNALKQYKQDLIDKHKVNKKGDVCDISIKDYLKKSNEWKSLYKGFKCGQINCWKNKKVDLDTYMLGYWLGDGTSSGPEITTGQYNKQINLWSNNDNKINKFTIALNKYNLLNNKHVPYDYKINDIETRLQLLAGFLDANGHLSRDNNFEFCQKSKKLFDDIVFIARSLGLTVSIGKSKVINNITYYRANIYGHGVEKIPTKINRKNATEYKHNKDNLTYEIKLEKLNHDNYYGFEIDGNKRFLLGDFTVTHNTSSVLAVAYQLFGPKIFNERVIELNASDERGINIVRYKINTFARTAIGNVDPDYPCPPFKLVILDEADAMTTEAQSALRKVMEELSSITRFCFICNYKNQIIDPIVSRCMKFRFKPVDKLSMHNKLVDVSKKEFMNIDNDSINSICSIVKGDVRKGIMILQNLRYILNYKSEITKQDVYNMTGHTSPEYIKPIWNICLDKNSNIKKILNHINKIKKNGIPITSILENLQLIVIDSNINDLLKSKICIHIASTEKCLIDGADEYIQLLNIFSYIFGLLNNYIDNVPDNIC